MPEKNAEEHTWGGQAAWGIRLLAASGCETPKLDAHVLLAFVLDVPRSVLMAYPERALAESDIIRYHDLIQRRAQGEPTAYITGKKWFMGLEISVDPRALIPRPETELLVEAASRALESRFGVLPDEDDIPDGAVPDILAADIGTGSGAIALALLTLAPRIGRIFAVDISQDALTLAQSNCDRAHMSDRVTLLQGNLLEPVPVPVDLIIANLPYIDTDPAAHGAQPNVVKYEPHMALFSEDHGLRHIFSLLEMAKAKLKSGGIIALEHGFDQQDRISEFALRIFPRAAITCGKDYAGWDRFVVIQLPAE